MTSTPSLPAVPPRPAAPPRGAGQPTGEPASANGAPGAPRLTHLAAVPRAPGFPDGLAGSADASPWGMHPVSSGAAGRVALGLGDPLALLLRLAGQDRDARVGAGEAGRRAADAVADLRLEQHRDAVDAARRASRRAGRALGLGRRLQRVFDRIAVAVGAGATVVTGGGLPAVVAAGSTLLLASNRLVEHLVDQGWVSSDSAPWLEQGLRLAGTSTLNLGALGATHQLFSGDAIARTAAQAQLALTYGRDSVDGASQAWAGAVAQHQTGLAAVHGARADAWAGDADDALADAADRVDDLGDALAAFARVRRRVEVAATLRAEARLAALGHRSG